jgi:hypothetical protein
MIMPKNNGIVNLLITVTLQDTTSPQPLTPLFTVLADSQQTAPGRQGFSCDGRGDNNQELLKDILRKIIESYPMKPIGLCIVGAEIVADASCVAAPTAQPLDYRSGGVAFALTDDDVSGRAIVKATPKKASTTTAELKTATGGEDALKKAGTKTAATTNAEPKTTAVKKGTPEIAAAKKVATTNAESKKAAPKKSAGTEAALTKSAAKKTGAKHGSRKKAAKKSR